MLGRIKQIKVENLKHLILEMDECILNENVVSQYIAYCPTKDEIDIFQSYSGDVNKLRSAEQFLYFVIYFNKSYPKSTTVKTS